MLVLIFLGANLTTLVNHEHLDWLFWVVLAAALCLLASCTTSLVVVAGPSTGSELPPTRSQTRPWCESPHYMAAYRHIIWPRSTTCVGPARSPPDLSVQVRWLRGTDCLAGHAAI